MKKLLVITIIACVSLSASAHRRSSFLSSEEMLADIQIAQALNAQSQPQNNDNQNQVSETELKAKQQMEQDYYENLRNLKIQDYNNAANIKAEQSKWDLLTASENGSAGYNNRIVLNKQFVDANANDKVLKNNRLQEWRDISKGKVITNKSDVQTSAYIHIKENQAKMHIASNELENDERNSDTLKCLNQAKSLISVYGDLAIDAIDSTLLQECPGILNTVVRTMGEQRMAVTANYEHGVVVNGFDYLWNTNTPNRSN